LALSRLQVRPQERDRRQHLVGPLRDRRQHARPRRARPADAGRGARDQRRGQVDGRRRCRARQPAGRDRDDGERTRQARPGNPGRHLHHDRWRHRGDPGREGRQRQRPLPGSGQRFVPFRLNTETRCRAGPAARRHARAGPLHIKRTTPEEEIPMSSKQDLTRQFTAEEGIIHIGGIEALVRLTMDQIRFDRRRGLNNAMFISGYRGSPVGMLDANFIKQQKLLMQHNIQFVDGLNEDLAATAVWGTQMLHTVGNQKFDGVVGTWYGKAPGVDRSGDVLKHANYTGTLKNGGVLAIFGDDPSCKSSSLPSQSEAMFYHVGIPSLYPANVQDILDFGLHGYYLSRISGLWAGLKIVTNVADGSGSAIVTPDRMKFVTPVVELDGRPYTPEVNLGMNVRKDALDMERTLYYARQELARQYARENGLNKVTPPNADAWLGIITACKTYHDL